MKKIILVILFLLCDFPAQADDKTKPQILNFSIGGFLDGGQALKINNGKLSYILRQPAGPSKTEPLKITEQKWQQFRQELDKANVWSWPSSCFNQNVADGTQWELEISYGDKAIKTSGSNSYPGADGKCSDDPNDGDFQILLTAFKNLTGKDIR